MKSFRNPFGWLAFIFFMLGGTVLLIIEKGDIVLYLNSNHTPFLDQFMKYATFLGDGLMLIPLFLGMLFYRYYSAVAVIFLSLFILLFSQGLKRTAFSGWPRPTAYFEENIEWNTVDGVEIRKRNTFPSGHTIAGFGIMFFLGLTIKRRWVYFTCFILAALVGISRVYLLQHFFIDVYVGAILGMIAASLAYYLPGRIFSERLSLKLNSKSLLRR